MTVTVTDITAGPFYPNGVTTAFPFDFKVPSADELRVFTLTDGVDVVHDPGLYSVSISEDGEGGAVNFTVAPSADLAPLYVMLDPLFEQQANFNNNGFLPRTLNPAFDRAAARDLFLLSLASRAVKLPLGEDGFIVPPITDAEGKSLAVVDGEVVWVPNDSASAAALLNEVQIIGSEVAADQAEVEADRILINGYKAASLEAASDASDFADDAETAAIAAAAAGKKFTTTGLGIGGTVDGDYFVTPVAGGLAIWQNVAGVATAWPAAAPNQKVIATSESLAAAVADVVSAAATVGMETGNPNARAALGGIADNAVSLRAAAYYGVREKGLIANRVLSAPAAAMLRTVRFIGHSAVAGSGVVLAGAAVNPRSGINGSIPRHLEFLLQQFDPEWRVVNHGQSAQTSSEIAARMGALPMLITLAAGTTLASAGAVTCTVSPTPYGPSSRRGTSADDYYGKIGNQPCLLKNTGTGPNANSPIYSIEQIGGTADITINPGTPFTLDRDLLDYAINIFWATRNDNNNELSFAMQGAMVDKLPPGERRYVVMGDWNFVNAVPPEDLGDTRHTAIMAENAELRARYRSNFFDVYAFLRGDYPYDGSLYRSVWQMTGEDINQAANDWPDQIAQAWKTTGRIPRRWMSIHLGGGDKGHFNEQTYYWLDQALIEFHFTPKGWLLP